MLYPQDYAEESPLLLPVIHLLYHPPINSMEWSPSSRNLTLPKLRSSLHSRSVVTFVALPQHWTISKAALAPVHILSTTCSIRLHEALGSLLNPQRAAKRRECAIFCCGLSFHVLHTEQKKGHGVWMWRWYARADRRRRGCNQTVR
jgi:hypothetical protein